MKFTKSPATQPMNAARFLLVLMALLVPATGRAQTYTQTFELRPGWNAIWLEVDPSDRKPDALFDGIPIQSAWTWSERVSATDFIQNPGEAGWNRAQWLSYFPPSAPESVLSTLRSVLPQRGYLIRLAGSNTVTWAVGGRPVLRKASWVPDRFNLRGFPVDPAVPVSFRSFFRSSTAHCDASADRLEAIYRLAADGRWSEVGPQDQMRRGEAYWVFSRGSSDFVAPFHVELNSGETADFDATTRTVALTLFNRHALAKSLRVENAATNLNHLVRIPDTVPGQPAQPESLGQHVQQVASGASARLTLAVDRSKLPTANVSAVHETLVSVSDQEGTLFLVTARALAEAAPSYAGLWLGTAVVNQVAPSQDSGGSAGSGDVMVPFPLRVLLHVDGGGQVKLLRDVTLVFAATNSAAGSAIPNFTTRPARLLTDPSVVDKLSPIDLRSGRLAGRRLTAPHFDFAQPDGQFGLTLTGTFAPSNQLTGELVLPADHPTNPFLHRYHPDHGTNRSYVITRTLQFSLGGTDTASAPPGELAINGTYSETLEGLHKNVLSTSGVLSLRRISEVTDLNAP